MLDGYFSGTVLVEQLTIIEIYSEQQITDIFSVLAAIRNVC